MPKVAFRPFGVPMVFGLLAVRITHRKRWQRGRCIYHTQTSFYCGILSGFASYRHVKPNTVHHWLADKRLVTQNIDGLDGKAGNAAYVPIHGRLDKVTVLHEQGLDVPLIDAPWEDVAAACNDLDDSAHLARILLDAFKISKKTLTPEPDVSLKPFVLLFDEYYTDLYRMSEAEDWMQYAQSIVFMGTSFSVNITSIALRTAIAMTLPLRSSTHNQLTLDTRESNIIG